MIQGRRFWRRNFLPPPGPSGRMIVCQDRLGSNTTMRILGSEERAAALSLPFCSSQVKTDCWTEDPAVVAWMKGRNLTAMGALGYFQMRVQEIVEKHGKSAMFWDEFWVSQVGAAAQRSAAAQCSVRSLSQLLTSAADLSCRPQLTISSTWITKCSLLIDSTGCTP